MWAISMVKLKWVTHPPHSPLLCKEIIHDTQCENAMRFSHYDEYFQKENRETWGLTFLQENHLRILNCIFPRRIELTVDKENGKQFPKFMRNLGILCAQVRRCDIANFLRAVPYFMR